LTCYLRHIKQLLEKSGIEVTPDNKREIDRRIHELMGVEYKDCPGAWSELKKRLAQDESAFIASLKKSLANA
jgi:hypothetical protein